MGKKLILEEDKIKVKDEVSKISSQLDSALKQVNELEHFKEKTLQELELEREKHTNLDKYWSDRHSQSLSGQSHEIKTLLSYPGVERAVLDFGLNIDDIKNPVQFYKFPQELIKLAGDLNLGIEVSFYNF